MRNNVYYQTGLSGNCYVKKKESVYYHSEEMENGLIRVIKCDLENKCMKVRTQSENGEWNELELNNLKEREQVLNSYSDEYIEKVINNLYSSSDTYIIKDLLCELFMEDVPDYVVKKFLEIKENVQIDEFIDMYKECIGENCFSFLLSF